MIVVLLLACEPDPVPTRDPAPAPTPSATPSPVPTPPTPPCAPEGTFTCPIPVGSLPADDTRDTRDGPSDLANSYPCAPDTDESGPEWVYAVDAPGRGILTAVVQTGSGVDIDVHLLATADPDSCLARDNLAAAWVVDAGTWFVTLDTWVDADGVALAGEYTVSFDFLPLDAGPCATVDTDLEMYWDDCAVGIDCVAGDPPLLRTPSWGPVVGEAHLVTVDDGFGNSWPTSFTDGIDAHYALSEAETGYVMARDQPWAPAGEGGSEYGQAAYGSALPVEDEAWYVNMYWRDRPDPGTRMLVIQPFARLAVVAAGGYETGPGANDAIGGACEEIHHALGSDHRDRLVMGFTADPDLPLGPITCW